MDRKRSQRGSDGKQDRGRERESEALFEEDLCAVLLLFQCNDCVQTIKTGIQLDLASVPLPPYMLKTPQLKTSIEPPRPPSHQTPLSERRIVMEY